MNRRRGNGGDTGGRGTVGKIEGWGKGRAGGGA